MEVWLAAASAAPSVVVSNSTVEVLTQSPGSGQHNYRDGLIVAPVVKATQKWLASFPIPLNPAEWEVTEERI